MGSIYTEQQQKVIDHRNGGLLVSAAAGSGKTTVMVEQIVRLITDPQDPVSIDHILVVTFTRAAAGSMKKKLEDRLQEELERDPDNDRLEEQIRMIPLSSVTTNHSFSLQLVKDYITRIDGIDPGFRVAEETETELLKNDVLHAVLEEMYTEALDADPAEGAVRFMALVNTYGGKRQDKNLEKLVLDLYSCMMSDPYPVQWLDHAIETLDPAYRGAGSLFEIGELTEEDTGKQERISRLMLPAMQGLKILMDRFDAAYRKEKAARNIMEFDDFEHNALKLLEDPAIADVLREKYRYIFVDEYQDCNRLQETIIQRIARKDSEGTAVNVFMVGDVKQSIYGFRQADPSLFMGKYNTYEQKDHAELICLNRNFRSGVEVIDSVNAIFESLMRCEAGGIDYGEKEKLFPADYRLEQHRTGFETKMIVETGSRADERLQAEAVRTGKEIQKIVAGGEYSYRDIVILMRAAGPSAQIFYDVLSSMDIPVVTKSNSSFYDTIEIRTILNLLSVVDNPHQDIPLMGVLHSPIVGMDDNDLGKIRLARRDGEYYEALKEYASVGADTETVEKAVNFLRNLERWRALSRLLTIHDLLWTVYRETGYYLYASSMPGGSLRRANLDLLLERSISFESGSFSGLYQFLRYVEKMQKTNTVEEEAGDHQDRQNSIQIMTIHKSKGLEFPIVFLANMGKQFNMDDLKGTIILHNRLGIGADLVDAEQHLVYGDVRKTWMKEEIRREYLAEEIRVLYVAMTRAKEKLIMIGGRSGDPKEQEFDTEGRMTPESIVNARCFLDWVEPILLKKSPLSVDYEVEVPESSEIPSDSAEEKRESPDNGGREPDSASILSEQSIKISEETQGSSGAASETTADLSEVKAKLLWKYPGEWKTHVPQVISVSEVKHARMEEAQADQENVTPSETAFFIKNDADSPEPQENRVQSQPEAAEKENSGGEKVPDREKGSAFPDGKTVSVGAMRGTAYHEIMARCRMDHLSNAAEVEEEIQRICREGFLTEEEAKLVDRRWILRFGSSSLCRRICASKEVHREQAFVLNLSLKELEKMSERYDFGGDGSESVILQGIIDLYFMEGDEIVLADYKTDAVLDDAAVAGYSVQLQIYAKALEEALGRKVCEKFLYDVRRGKEIHC